MKIIKTIIADNLKIDYLKMKKDYVVYLQTKSLPNKKSWGLKAPKVGVKAADCLDNKTLSLFEYTGKKLGWKLLNEFTPTEVEKAPTRIYYKVQKYLHKDILLSKGQVELFYSDGSKAICTGFEAVSYLLGENISINKIEPKKDLLSTPDWKLTGLELQDKMRLEIEMGICPL